MNVKIVAVAAGLGLVLAAVALPVADRIASRRIANVLDHGEALLPAGISAKYAGVSYSLLTGITTITGVSLSSRANGVTGTETIDEVAVKGLAWNLGDVFARFQAAPGSLTRDTVVPVADLVTLTGIRSQAPNLELTLAQVTVAGIRLRPWALYQPGIPSLAQIVHQVTAPPPRLDGPNGTAAALAQATPLMRFGAAVALAFAYDRATEVGLEEDLWIPATAGAPAQRRHIALARANLSRGFRDAVLGPIDDEDFREGSGAATLFTIARVDSAGFDLRAPAERIVAGAPVSRDLLDGLKIGDITLSGVTMDIPSAGPVTITRLGIDGIGFGHGVVESAHAGVEQLHLTDAALALAPTAAAALQSLDLHALTISAEIGFRWDVEQQAVTLDRTELRVDELGDLGFEGRVEGVSPALSLQNLRDTAVVREGRLTYRDASLTRRLIAAGAAQAHTDVASMRQRLVEAIQQQAATFGSGPVVANLLSAVTDFIQAPTSLSLTMKPPIPLPLTDLLMQRDEDPQTLLDRLGVTALANQ